MKFWNIGIHNKERIFQGKIIFKQKLYLEISVHFSMFSELNKSEKHFYNQSFFFNGLKHGSRYWAYDLYYSRP